MVLDQYDFRVRPGAKSLSESWPLRASKALGMLAVEGSAKHLTTRRDRHEESRHVSRHHFRHPSSWMKVIVPNSTTHRLLRTHGESIGDRVVQDAGERGPGGEYEYGRVGMGAGKRGSGHGKLFVPANEWLCVLRVLVGWT